MVGAALAKAQAFMRAGRRNEAIRFFRSALASDPDSVEASCGLVRALLETQALGEAVDALSFALSRSRFDMRLLCEQKAIGLALHAANFWEDAGPWLARAAELEPWDEALAGVLARIRRPRYLGDDATDATTGKPLRRFAAREGDAYIYVIDIVGVCNLRCPTCPVGNSVSEGRPRGTMRYDLFRRIVRKIQSESPCERPIVNLYNWGEPLLNPDLPRMIGLLRDAGFHAALSTNLNIRRGLEAVIAANPDELKISLSGFTDEIYRRTHAGGDLGLVKENMSLVRRYADRHRASTRIWVGHHIYRSNEAQIPDVRRACEELGFEYHPIHAFYMPLERLVERLDGKSNPLDHGIVADLFRSPEEISQGAAQLRSGRFDCELRFNQTVINHDGSVALCCATYDQENMLGVDFLDADFREIEERKYAHSFCRVCYAKRLEFAPPELDMARRSCLIPAAGDVSA